MSGHMPAPDSGSPATSAAAEDAGHVGAVLVAGHPFAVVGLVVLHLEEGLEQAPVDPPAPFEVAAQVAQLGHPGLAGPLERLAQLGGQVGIVGPAGSRRRAGSAPG